MQHHAEAVHVCPAVWRLAKMIKELWWFALVIWLFPSFPAEHYSANVTHYWSLWGNFLSPARSKCRGSNRRATPQLVKIQCLAEGWCSRHGGLEPEACGLEDGHPTQFAYKKSHCFSFGKHRGTAHNLLFRQIKLQRHAVKYVALLVYKYRETAEIMFRLKAPWRTLCSCNDCQ